MLTWDEVIWGYRYLLDRDPENALALSRHAERHSDWRQFREVLLRSEEFRAKGVQIGSKWIAAEVFNGERLIWLHLADNYVSRGALLGDYEAVETEFLRKRLKPGHVFLDIGANIGWFTLLASTIIGQTGHVHAFEPRRPTVDYLKKSIAMNGLDALVTVHDFGLDCATGEGVLVWEPTTRNPGHSYLIDANPGAGAEAQPVRLIELDSLNLPRVDVVKMDAEGAEMRVIEGGWRTFEESRPIILSELYPDQLRAVSNASPKEFIDWFRSRGYEATIVDSERNGETISDFPSDWKREVLNVGFEPLKGG